MRLGYVGSLPPRRDGIAEHNGLLLSSLSKMIDDIYCYINQKRVNEFPNVDFINLPILFDLDDFHQYPDLFHLQFGDSYPNYYLLRFFNKVKRGVIPLISTLHDRRLNTFPGLYRSLVSEPYTIFYYINAPHIRQVLERSDKVIVYSNHLKNIIESNYNLPSEKIEVIYHSVDIERFFIKASKRRVRRRLGLDDEFLMVSYGNITPRKGYEEVIEAIKLLREDGIKCKYLIIGKFNYIQYKLKLLQSVRKLDLVDTVFFPGYIDWSDVPLYLRAADLLIQSRRYTTEGASGSLVAGLASGTPVIASKTGSFIEYVDHGKTGVLVEHQRERYYDEIKRYYEHMNSQLSLGMEAVKWCKTNIDKDVIAKRHLELYLKVV